MKLFSRFLRDETGVTAIEYGLIAALISVVCVGAMTAAGKVESRAGAYRKSPEKIRERFPAVKTTDLNRYTKVKS